MQRGSESGPIAWDGPIARFLETTTSSEESMRGSSRAMRSEATRWFPTIAAQ